MIGILGGMGTQAGLDFCNKLAKLNRGKLDQQYPMFVLYNKSNTPRRPENLKKYYNVLNELVDGCKMLQKNKCKFIVMPCNTAHYWHEDIQKKIKIPLLSMPKAVYLHTKKTCINYRHVFFVCWKDVQSVARLIYGCCKSLRVGSSWNFDVASLWAKSLGVGSPLKFRR